MAQYENNQVAFALGGLAGNNAYGAGFLQAALNCNVKPAMITCTSGQIYWVAEYLSYLRHQRSLNGCTSLGEALRQHLSEQTPYGLLAAEFKEHVQAKFLSVPPAAVASIAKMAEAACSVLPMPRDAVFSLLFWHGKDKRYGPAWLDYTRDLLTNSVAAAFDIAAAAMSGRLDQVFLTERWFGIWPSRSLQPLFPTEFFQEIADLMNNESDIGIAFNSYDAMAGLEYIYVNPPALKLLDHQPGNNSRYRERAIYKAIDANAVRAALWLYQYGFPGNMSLLDGAYYRDVMLSEACVPSVGRIYAVRPISAQWQGPLPQRLIDGKDFETEIGFNGAFAGEYGKMRLIRKLANDFTRIKQKVGVKLPKDVDEFFHRYQEIEVVPVELKLRRGFFDYVFEGGEVFDAGFADACFAFRSYGNCVKGITAYEKPCPLPEGQPLMLKQVA